MQFRWCYFTVIQKFIWLNHSYILRQSLLNDHVWIRFSQKCVLQLILQHRHRPRPTVWRVRDTFQGLTQHLVENHILNGHQLLLCTKSLSTSSWVAKKRWIKSLVVALGPVISGPRNWRASSNEMAKTRGSEDCGMNPLLRNWWRTPEKRSIIWSLFGDP